MTPEKLQSVAFRWMEAFNAHNLTKLLSLYDDNAEHYSPKLKMRNPESNGIVTGKAALHDWWQQAFEQLPSLQYKIISITAGSGRVFMEYIRSADGQADLPVAEVLEVKDDTIVSSRVYHG